MKIRCFLFVWLSLCFSDVASARILKVVFTGGPGSGKSSSLNDQITIETTLTELGRTRIYAIPEAATPTLAKFGKFDLAWMDDFYAFLLGRQFEDERNAVQLAEEALSAGEIDTAVLVYDRAWVDNVAYWPDGRDSFRDRYLKDLEFHELDDAHVLFFEQPPEQFYTTANNAVRSESHEQATARSALTFRAWEEHGAKIYRIPVMPKFEDRSVLVWQVISHLVRDCEDVAKGLLAAFSPE